ncbi:MAG: dehydrogenase E1 component subunit alpha/beta [Pseudomonadota bacterium]
MADLSLPPALQGLPAAPSNTLSPADLEAMVRQMHLIRRFETRTKELFLAGEIKGTAHSSVGQEAIAVGACKALQRQDLVLTHHRGHGHTIAKGADIVQMFGELFGRETGNCGGLGGSMHIADLSRGILGANGIVGAGMGLGTGAALAAKLNGEGAVAVAFFGDGAANEGIFHEAMNLAAVWRLPLILFCENNQYGLSTPTHQVTAGPGIHRRAEAYGIPGERVDGNDAPAVHTVMSRAVLRAREGDGPTLIEAMTYRWDDHSMRANLPAYRGGEELAQWQTADPLVRLNQTAIAAGALSAEDVGAIAEATAKTVEEAIEAARAAAEPTLAVAAQKVMAPATVQPGEEPPEGTRTLTYAEAITEAIHLEMARDDKVIVIGEDVGAIGGIFGLTRGLMDAFGPERVRDTPISEGAIAGCGVGAALSGYRPICEIQLFDFVSLMMDGIVNQAAKARFMLGGAATVPIVFRGPQGAGIRLAAQHGQSLEALFANVPGLEVYAPASAYDAKGLMAAAIRSDNPVVFLEHKLLYLGDAQTVPEMTYAIAPGTARVCREGKDVTIIATMAMVERALQAADRLAREGIEATVIDPRTIRPFDLGTIIDSIKTTNRAVVVHEAPVFGGFGAEIAASIMDAAFDHLDAPVARVGAPDMPVPYNDRLEREYMPSARTIAAACRKVLYVH